MMGPWWLTWSLRVKLTGGIWWYFVRRKWRGTSGLGTGVGIERMLTRILVRAINNLAPSPPTSSLTGLIGRQDIEFSPSHMTKNNNNNKRNMTKFPCDICLRMLEIPPQQKDTLFWQKPVENVILYLQVTSKVKPGSATLSQLALLRGMWLEFFRGKKKNLSLGQYSTHNTTKQKKKKKL